MGALHGIHPPPVDAARFVAPGVATDPTYDDMVLEATRRALAHLEAHDTAVANGTARDSDPLDPFAAIQHPSRRAFLRALAVCGNRSRACRAVGIDRSTPHSRPWKEDPDFMEALPIAEELGAEILELEAQRRAIEGTVKAVGWYKGVPGGYEREYSDTLLLALMKAGNPNKFGDKLALRGAIANLDVSQLPDWAVERIAKGEHPLSVLASGQDTALPSGRDVTRDAPRDGQDEGQ